MRTTSKVMQIKEAKGGKDIKEILSDYYCKRKLSDRRIVEAVREELGIKVPYQHIRKWRLGLGIESRSLSEAALLDRRTFGQTDEMTALKSAMHGASLDLVIPFLFVLGYTYKMVQDFLKQKTGKIIHQNTLSRWMREWGYKPGQMNKPVRSKIKSQALREFYSMHPKAIERITQSNILRFSDPQNRHIVSLSLKRHFDKNPKARENLSELTKQRWQKAKSKVYCPLVEEFISPEDCTSMQETFLQQCQENECAELNKK